MTNWERKSSYLLREIVKFRTYIDALQIAQTQKERIYAEEDGKATASTAPSHATLQDSTRDFTPKAGQRQQPWHELERTETWKREAGRMDRVEGRGEEREAVDTRELL